jgi:hypothetical protein
MAHRRGFTVAVSAAFLMMSFMYGCSRDLPTSTSVSSVGAARPLPGPGQPPGTVDFALLPDATSTIRHFPEMGILDVAPVSGDLQSSYFRTTETNREFRRGFAEFIVPALHDGFRSARIVLSETRATIGLPVPPDRHELSFYANADLVVDPSDFDRPTSPVGTFETDANLEGQTFALDVTTVVAQELGSNIGFRVKLESDPAETGFRPLGSAFSPSTTPPGVVIQLTGASPADAIDYMRHVIGRLELPPAVEASLLDPLGRALLVLRDDVPGNDHAACGHLTAFLAALKQAVGTEQAPGELGYPESGYLKETAGNVAAALGCPGTSGS